MKFRYSARTKTGELQVGFVEAPAKEGALNVLAGHELYVLSLETIKPSPFLPALTLFKRVRRKDLMIFTRQFSTMLEAKIPINDALKALYSQTRSLSLREVVYEISADVESGLSLSQAFERHSEVFSEFYINLLRAAEITGRVEEASRFLADHLEKDAILVAKIRNAMTYPVFVIALFFVACAAGQNCSNDDNEWTRVMLAFALYVIAAIGGIVGLAHILNFLYHEAPPE